MTPARQARLSITPPMTAVEALDIPYTPSAIPDPLLRFDLHSVRGDAIHPDAGLLVFVHGGAWRAYETLSALSSCNLIWVLREDKRDHAGLAKRLAEATRWPVLVPNYRLSTSTTRTAHMFRHPGHAEDILAFLKFLGEWEPPSDLEIKYNPGSVVLIGHSCSAHMLTSIFLDSDHATPSLKPPAPLLEAVKGIAMSEGIYDIDRLVNTFPLYHEWFIDDAFGACENYGLYNVSRYQLRPEKKTPVSWLILHSTADTLVDAPQSQIMLDHLCELHGDTAGKLIFRSFDKLNEEHDEILRGDEYVKLIQEFVGHIHGLAPQVDNTLP